MASDLSALARADVAAVSWLTTVRVSSMVTPMSVVQFLAFSLLFSGADGVFPAICSARISSEAATSTAAPLTVLL